MGDDARDGRERRFFQLCGFVKLGHSGRESPEDIDIGAHQFLEHGALDEIAQRIERRRQSLHDRVFLAFEDD